MLSFESQSALDYDLIFLAWHEASHTVVAFHNFFQVLYTYIRVKPEDSITHWYTSKNIEDLELKRIILLLEMQTEYAGLIGEQLLYKELTGASILPKNLKVGISDDLKLISDTIRYNNLAKSGKETKLLKKNIQNKTKKIIIEYWNDIKLIAHFLYDKRYLEYKDLKFILTRKSKNKKFWKTRLSKIDSIYGSDDHPNDDTIKSIIYCK